MSNRELLSALADELTQGEELLRQPLQILFDRQLPQECSAIAKLDYCDFVTRVAGVAEAINLGSLRALMAFVDANVSMLAELPASQREVGAVGHLLQCWPSVLAELVRDPGNRQREQALRQLLLDSRWPWRVDEVQFEGMLADMRRFADSTEKTSLHSDEEELLDPTPADVSLSIPGDISPKLLSTFQQELPQSTAELSQRIQRLFHQQATSEDISEARRVAHTLKGAANIVGVVGIANVTHYLEDILESLVGLNALPHKELSDILTDAVDCLEIMSEATLGIVEPPPQALTVLQTLLDWRQRFLRGTVGELRQVSAMDESSMPAQLNSEAVTAAPPAIPVEQRNIFDSLLDIAGELSSTNLLTQGQLQSVTKHFESIGKYYSRLRASMGMLQEMVFSRELKRSYSSEFRFDSGMSHNFDTLEMDQYNELHSISNLMTEILDDIADTSKVVSGELNEIRELLNQQDQFNKELDESITAERLVPVASIVPRLQRSVRQTCRMVNKQVELRVSGDSLSIDNSILDSIVDPLLHMLRNAVDHGVEYPEQRLAAGKAETALIELGFARAGNSIVIRCKDDGRGIDDDAVKIRALQLGLLQPDEVVGEGALYELILQPGFTTKTDADQVSGRGVGMDVVAKKIADLRGSLAIESEPGRGAEFIITVPQTLLKSHVVLLSSDDFIFGVLSNSFSQIITIDSGLVFNDEEDDDYLSFNDRIYEVNNLAKLLGVRLQLSSKPSRKVAILVDDGEFMDAVLIDEAIASGEFVIKKVGHYVPRVGGIVGTVLAANGTPAPVFDLKELLRKPSQLVADYLQQQIEQPLPSAIKVLIVDDSSSARRSMSQVARDAGYDVRTAIDGIEAISLIEEQRPDLLLTDLEMPKMNGLELAAHLRSMDSTRDLPIVMVTSRSTEKHRAQALSTGVNSYITKPYTNDDLILQMHRLLAR